LESRTQEYFTLESNGSKTVSLPVTFTYTNIHTGVSQVDNTWVTSGNGKCFLRLPKAIVDEKVGQSPGYLDPERLEAACREHNEMHPVPSFQTCWGGWQWMADRRIRVYFAPTQIPEYVLAIAQHISLPNGKHGYNVNPKERPPEQQDSGVQDCGTSGELVHLARPDGSSLT
jgi:hypothetical protein